MKKDQKKHAWIIFQKNKRKKALTEQIIVGGKKTSVINVPYLI